jgi:hypothetical protein
VAGRRADGSRAVGEGTEPNPATAPGWDNVKTITSSASREGGRPLKFLEEAIESALTEFERRSLAGRGPVIHNRETELPFRET